MAFTLHPKFFDKKRRKPAAAALPATEPPPLKRKAKARLAKHALSGTPGHASDPNSLPGLLGGHGWREPPKAGQD